MQVSFEDARNRSRASYVGGVKVADAVIRPPVSLGEKSAYNVGQEPSFTSFRSGKVRDLTQACLQMDADVNS